MRCFQNGTSQQTRIGNWEVVSPGLSTALPLLGAYTRAPRPQCSILTRRDAALCQAYSRASPFAQLTKFFLKKKFPIPAQLVVDTYKERHGAGHQLLELLFQALTQRMRVPRARHCAPLAFVCAFVVTRQVAGSLLSQLPRCLRCRLRLRVLSLDASPAHLHRARRLQPLPLASGDLQGGSAPEEQQKQQQSGQQIGGANNLVSASFGDLMVSKLDSQEQAKRRVGAA